MFPFFFDWTMILILPAIILAVWAQSKVKNSYSKYSRIATRSGMTGAQVARRILDATGLSQIPIEAVGGELTDHYDPTKKKLRLSKPVFASNSLAAVAVAAHETGHAVQDQAGYTPMNIRAKLVPIASFGSNAAIPLFFIGLFIPMFLGLRHPVFSFLMDLGILFFVGAVLFHLVTLPVEFNASARAIKILSDGGYLTAEEIPHAQKMLNAAAWTYVAAASMAILQLIRLLILRGTQD